METAHGLLFILNMFQNQDFSDPAIQGRQGIPDTAKETNLTCVYLQHIELRQYLAGQSIWIIILIQNDTMEDDQRCNHKPDMRSP